MAHYLVKAQPVPDKLEELRQRLERGEIFPMRPFGSALDYSLKNARQAEDGWIVWEEEDYCRPPLAMERAAVLDDYFTNLTVEKVAEGEGWSQIQALPPLWQQ
ncbi:MAG: hypothetical protein QNJ45_11560 [Ardenticatenaceae bacterium]|nr:hypothetical protein [Ardenticatenaceae bacterium]